MDEGPRGGEAREEPTATDQGTWEAGGNGGQDGAETFQDTSHWVLNARGEGGLASEPVPMPHRCFFKRALQGTLAALGAHQSTFPFL